MCKRKIESYIRQHHHINTNLECERSGWAENIPKHDWSGWPSLDNEWSLRFGHRACPKQGKDILPAQLWTDSQHSSLFSQLGGFKNNFQCHLCAASGARRCCHRLVAVEVRVVNLVGNKVNPGSLKKKRSAYTKS